MGEKVLITGGAGFIGSNLARELLLRGYEVVVLDNFLTGRRRNIHDILPHVRLVEGDIRDPDACMNACKGTFAVLHQAALPSVPRSVKNPLETNSINITGTLQILQAARDCGVERFLFASSSSVCGDTPVLPKVETMTPAPLSPYALQKLAGEHYVRLFNELYGMYTLSMRYFNIFGPAQDPDSTYAAVVPTFMTAAHRGTSVKIFGDGEQSRDFTHVENVLKANLLALNATGLKGQAVNIACGERYTVNTLLDTIEEISGVRIARNYIDARPGDVKHSQADISLAKELIGYGKVVGFREGLLRTFRMFTPETCAEAG